MNFRSGNKKKRGGSALERYGRNLSELAANGALPPLIGRRDEMLKITQILLQSRKINLILIGEPGVGKTGIVEGFAQLLEDGKLPKELGRPAVRRVDILSTMPMGGEKDTACAARLSLFIGRWARRPRSVKAGTKYRGEFEERVEALVREASQEPKPILFIDDLPSSDLDGFHHLYLHIVDSGYTQNPSPEAPPGPKRRGRRKQSKARNLLDRFRDHPESILAFMYDFDVPFDNNLSERDLRMEKLRQNISGTFRSFAALVDFCRIRSYISTARKNGLTALEALRRIYQGNPFLPTASNE